MSRDVLLGRISTRLTVASDDELRVFDRILERVAAGREIYGPLCLESDRRDPRAEAADELTDCLFYLAADFVARDLRRAVAAAKQDPVAIGLRELAENAP